jgi:hypothetical protein
LGDVFEVVRPVQGEIGALGDVLAQQGCGAVRRAGPVDVRRLIGIGGIGGAAQLAADRGGRSPQHRRDRPHRGAAGPQISDPLPLEQRHEPGAQHLSSAGGTGCWLIVPRA